MKPGRFVSNNNKLLTHLYMSRLINNSAHRFGQNNSENFSNAFSEEII